jgi:hypothetical protein
MRFKSPSIWYQHQFRFQVWTYGGRGKLSTRKEGMFISAGTAQERGDSAALQEMSDTQRRLSLKKATKQLQLSPL